MSDSNHLRVSHMEGRIAYFRYTTTYLKNKTYGAHTAAFQFAGRPRLINLGAKDVRSYLSGLFVSRAGLSRTDADQLVDPDEQYSGSTANNAFHKLVREVVPEADGTFARSQEVVIFRNHSDILQRVHSPVK